MKNEIWMPIKMPIDLTGRFEISSEGRLKRVGYFTKVKKEWKPDLILKISKASRYMKICIRHNGRTYNISIHRLVCYAFLPNPENKQQVNHINGIKHDNRLENLEWCTQSENIQHAQSIGILPYAKPKIKIYKKKEDRKRRMSIKVINIDTGEVYNSVDELCKMKGLNVKNIRRQVSGERFCYVPYRYVGREDKVKLPLAKEKTKNMYAKFSINGDLIEIFDYDKLENVVLKQRIGTFISGRSANVDGFIYKKVSADGSFIEPPKFISKRKIRIRTGIIPATKPIIKCNLDGVELQRYNSASEVAKEFNTDKRVFKKQIKRSPRNYYKGFIWKYGN